MNRGILLTATFLCPLALVSGPAAQAVGLYLFALTTPALLCGVAPSLRRQLVQLAVVLLASYYLFPLRNLLYVWFVDNSYPWSLIIESEVSTVVGVSGFFLLGMALLSPRYREQPVSAEALELWFHRGMLVAMLGLLIFVVYQVLTGYHYQPSVAYRVDRQLGNGLYRASGFATHPLSLAGLGLGLFSFYYGRVCGRFLWRDALIAFGFFLVVVASGSRAAMVFSLLLLLMIPIWELRRPMWQVLAVSAVVAALGLALVSLGFRDRFRELWIGSGDVGSRLEFWRVYGAMFRDHWVLGASPLAVQDGLALEYYHQLGLQQLHRKYNAHNIYLEVLATLGLVGMMVLLVLGVRMKTLLTRWLAVPEGTTLLRGLTWAVLAQLLFGLVQNNFYDTVVVVPLLGLFWLCIWWRLLTPVLGQDP